MGKFRSIPRGLLGPNRDGLADPEALTMRERMNEDPARLAVEQDRRLRQGPVVARLQRAADRALGRSRR